MGKIRRRMLSPDIWEDEHFGKLSDKAKILFIACISYADDEGRMSGNPANLRAVAFRFDSAVNEQGIDELLKEITSTLRNFKVYIKDGVRFIQLNSWEKYQTIRQDRKEPSKIPPYTVVDDWLSVGCQLVAPSKVNISKVNIIKTGKAEKNTPFIFPDDLKKEIELIHKEGGINLYGLIHKAKVALHWSAGQEFPVEVIRLVCKSYKNNRDGVKNQYAWFMGALKLAYMQYSAKENIRQHDEIKSQGCGSLGDILAKIKEEAEDGRE